METKSLISIQVAIEGHLCQFIMPVGISFGQAIDVSHQILKEVIKMAKESADKSNPNEKEKSGEE